MIQICNRRMFFEQVAAGLGVLRVLVMEMKAMLGVEIFVQSDVMITCSTYQYTRPLLNPAL